ISYAAAYLRCHYPAEFTCSTLNAQPMGFYSVATIVDDAKRHGVSVRAIDVTASEWHCTLEPAGGDFAVRMGLRFVKGLGEKDGHAIERARGEAAFVSMDDFVRRTGLDEGACAALASAGAFQNLGRERRSALWELPRLLSEKHLPLGLSVDEKDPEFP